MPLTVEHTTRYADALMTLALAAHRPATVVNTGTGYAVRVDFERGIHPVSYTHLTLPTKA